MANIQEKQNCAAESELLAYLYKEMIPSEAVKFDNHLADCSNCIDAFAEIAYSRFAVYEWQKLEFAPLETPEIRIPYEAATNAPGWFESMKASLSFRPQYALSAAFGTFLMIFVIGYVAINEDFGNEPLAGIPDAGSSMPVEPKIAADFVNVEVSSSAETPDNSSFDTNPAGSEVPRALTTSPRRSVMASGDRNIHRSGSSAVKINQTAVAPVASLTAPRLNEFDDTSDNSLRLSDIFDDIDTSE